MTVPPELQKMQDAIDYIQDNPDLFRVYESYAKAASDYTTAIEGTERKGKRIGEQIGERRGKQIGKQETTFEHARNGKAMGLTLEQIARVTGLTIAEVQKL